MPGPLQEMPEFGPETKWYWDAFWAMHTSRKFGMDVGFIPLSEILAFCQITGIEDYVEREEITYLVRSLDREFLTLYRKEREAKRPKKDR